MFPVECRSRVVVARRKWMPAYRHIRNGSDGLELASQPQRSAGYQAFAGRWKFKGAGTDIISSSPEPACFLCRLRNCLPRYEKGKKNQK